MTERPPSIFTAAAPASLSRRPALRTASDGVTLIGQKRHVGDDERAFSVPRTTAAVW